MKTPDFLAELDVRAIVRILADTASISDPAEQRRFVMQSLSTLVDADTWVWGVSPLLEPGQQPVYLYQHTHGLDDARMSRFLRAVEHPDTGAMTAPLAVAMLQAGSRVTRDRSRIVAPERFAISPARPFWEAADIGPLLISIGPVPGVGTSVAGFYRHVGAPEFTLRETRIMHIVLTELPWLHSAGLPHAAAAPAVLLSPRQRLVINHLVQGQSRQSIATHLGLSAHTVNGYVKGIYTRFGVRSQSELIARLSKGDGGDR